MFAIIIIVLFILFSSISDLDIYGNKNFLLHLTIYNAIFLSFAKAKVNLYVIKESALNDNKKYAWKLKSRDIRFIDIITVLSHHFTTITLR